MESKELFFKASRKKSETHWWYRKILKRWDIDHWVDDVIIIDTSNVVSISIDCDKKTGEFRLFYNIQDSWEKVKNN